MQQATRTTLAVEGAHLDHALNALRKAIAIEPDGDLRGQLTSAAADVAEAMKITHRRAADLAEGDARSSSQEA